jgi:hypothetical protein
MESGARFLGWFSTVTMSRATIRAEATMADPVADSKTPVLVAWGLIAAGLAIGVLSGITHGSLIGGIIAGLGLIPASYGMWKGIQQETQNTLAMSVVTALAALGIGGVLIVLRVVYWVR